MHVLTEGQGFAQSLDLTCCQRSRVGERIYDRSEHAESVADKSALTQPQRTYVGEEPREYMYSQWENLQSEVTPQ